MIPVSLDEAADTALDSVDKILAAKPWECEEPAPVQVDARRCETVRPGQRGQR